MSEQIEGFEQEPKVAKTPQTVKAVLLENIIGGVGAFGLAGLGAYWISGGDWGAVGAWSLSAGIAVACGLMLLRSSIDEVVDRWDYHVMLRDLAALEKENDLLVQRNAALQRDLTAAETFGAYSAARPGATVTDRNGDPMPAPAPTPIRNDAKRLIQLHFENGVWPAKDASCQKLAWTTTRWAEARDELQRHRVVTTQGKRTVVLVSSLAEALAILAGDTSSR